MMGRTRRAEAGAGRNGRDDFRASGRGEVEGCCRGLSGAWRQQAEVSRKEGEMLPPSVEEWFPASSLSGGRLLRLE